MFTQNWFQDNGKRWLVWLDRFKDKDNLKFLEIGCFEGRATCWVMDHILTGKNNTFDVIDTFEGSMEHKDRGLNVSKMLENFNENIKPFIGKVDIRIYQGKSQTHLTKFAENTFDFVYVDGSHRAPDVLMDLVLSFRTLKGGGVMIMDDYEWVKYDDKTLNPKIAIDAFLEVFKNEYILIDRQRQVVIEKI
jgi:SAM-dependent methyltransferase